MVRYIIEQIFEYILIKNKRSPIQCGCAFYQPNVRARIVGGIESVPHSWFEFDL